MSQFQTGHYQHFKGKKYLVLGVAKHSETKEDLVVYVTLYENDMASLWVRPLDMFTEEVEVNGRMVPRFRKIEE